MKRLIHFSKSQATVPAPRFLTLLASILFGIFAIGHVAILILVFPSSYFLARMLLPLWAIAFLFPGTVCLAVALSFAYPNYLAVLIPRAAAFFSSMRGIVAVIVMAMMFIVIAIWFAFGAKPITDDEEAFLFQAGTYLMGRIALPLPPAPESLSQVWMIMNWLWTTKYLWAHSLLLTIGLILGSPYVSTMFMAVTSLVIIYSIGKRTASQNVGIVATLLVGTSPLFWFMSGTLLSSVSMLFLILLFCHGWIRFEESPSAFSGLWLGLCLGWGFAVRPLTACCLAIPFLLLGVMKARSAPKKWLAGAIGFCAGGGVIVVMILGYNKLVTGEALTFPFVYYDPLERLGFGIRAEGLFTPWVSALNFAKSSFFLNSWLFGWPISILPALYYVVERGRTSLGLTGRGRQWPLNPSGLDSWDLVWLSMALSLCVGYFFYYWALTVVTMPIYYYELIFPLGILSAKGLLDFHERMTHSRLRGWSYFVPLFCLLSFLGNVIIFVPTRILDFQDQYEVARGAIVAAERVIKESALVFVGQRAPSYAPIRTLPYPSPDFSNQLLFVFLREDGVNHEAVRAFPDRTPYLVYHEFASREYVVKKLPRTDTFSSSDVERAGRERGMDGKLDLGQAPPELRPWLTFWGVIKD